MKPSLRYWLRCNPFGHREIPETHATSPTLNKKCEEELRTGSDAGSSNHHPNLLQVVFLLKASIWKISILLLLLSHNLLKHFYNESYVYY
jgi:hypothetical protein